MPDLLRLRMLRLLGPGVLVLLAAGPAAIGAEPAPGAKLDYSRFIRPILSDNCYRCHGPDSQTREAGLRLDIRAEAVKTLESGAAAIVAGDVAKSELVRRIMSTDPETMMPPPDSHKQLKDRDRQLLRRWVGEGAEYHSHWSLVAPQPQSVPAGKQQGWVRNEIDQFVLARLEAEGLKPSADAGRAALARRVSLDLTGLPPTWDEVQAFIADTREGAYESLVDRLLDSPRYGERMAMHWLDLARYADTHGYNNDGPRTQWPWRDWVINAFNSGMPYDQFITEQLAGDLLPNATMQQRLATAFNRNHVITSEGGIIEEEYRVEYVADRVHTTSTVLLGLSLQCARCHDHKFDPITQRDYYRFFAFFNNVPEGLLAYNQAAAAAPFINAPSPFQQANLEALDRREAELGNRRKQRESQIDDALARWESEAKGNNQALKTPDGLLAHLMLDEGSGALVHDAVDPRRTGAVQGPAKWTPGKSGSALSFEGQTHVDLGQLVAFENRSSFSIAAWVYPTSAEPGTVLSKMDEADAYRGFDLMIEGGKPAMHLIHHWPDNGLKVIAKNPLALNTWHHLVVTYDGSSKAAGITLYVNGKPEPLEATSDKLQDTIKTDKPLFLGRRTTSAPFRGSIDDVQFYSAKFAAGDAEKLARGDTFTGLADILKKPTAERTADEQARVRRYYLQNIDPPYREISAELAALTGQRAEFQKSLPPTMIMEEMAKTRPTFVLKRGEYDKPGESVTSGVPASLPPLPAGAPANRLGLARWLVDPAHPLTARVAVNRWWQLYFGNGIVETVEDFGSQGAWPSHPELLDWLARRLVESGWNVKAMQKLIVMSATYRQSSDVSPELRERDPKNVLVARGPRFRLPAETVRDSALAIAGLLVERVGGPSVRPYQPDGLWQDVSVERSAVYQQDHGEGLYRRSMYTFWKRTCPPPALATFDAPDRETCIIRRARTNTPLQALVLLNDQTYVEAARKFAERILLSDSATDAVRLRFAFLAALGRCARPEEDKLLLPLLEKARARFKATPAKAEQLVKVGESPRAGGLDTVELAAWTTVANVILTMDETICNH